LYFFFDWAFCTYRMKMDKALENYLLNSAVTTLSLNTRFTNLLTRLPWSSISPPSFFYYYSIGCCSLDIAPIKDL
jgi:hypothetical protein